MLRSVGTPSRVVFGLLYVDEPAAGGPLFGAHMWTEAWVGRWVALDATLAEPFVDAMRIKFGESALEGPTPGIEFFNLVNVLGQTAVEITRVGPEPVQPVAPRP